MSWRCLILNTRIFSQSSVAHLCPCRPTKPKSIRSERSPAKPNQTNPIQSNLEAVPPSVVLQLQLCSGGATLDDLFAVATFNCRFHGLSHNYGWKLKSFSPAWGGARWGQGQDIRWCGKCGTSFPATAGGGRSTRATLWPFSVYFGLNLNVFSLFCFIFHLNNIYIFLFYFSSLNEFRGIYNGSMIARCRVLDVLGWWQLSRRLLRRGMGGKPLITMPRNGEMDARLSSET